MTNQQIEQVIQMNEAGMSWKFIADYYNITKYKLNKQLKHYENNKPNSEWTQLRWAITDGWAMPVTQGSYSFNPSGWQAKAKSFDECE